MQRLRASSKLLLLNIFSSNSVKFSFFSEFINESRIRSPFLNLSKVENMCSFAEWEWNICRVDVFWIVSVSNWLFPKKRAHPQYLKKYGEILMHTVFNNSRPLPAFAFSVFLMGCFRIANTFFDCGLLFSIWWKISQEKPIKLS